MKANTITGILTILFGAALIASEGAEMTGAFIGSAPASFLIALSGTVIIILGMFALARAKGLEQHVKLSSAIKKDDRLLNLTRDAVRNQNVGRDLNHLVHELGKGNFQAGLGLRHVQETDVNEMRGRHGGRLYFRRIGQNDYEVVAKSSKSNQERVIERLKELYPV